MNKKIGESKEQILCSRLRSVSNLGVRIWNCAALTVATCLLTTGCMTGKPHRPTTQPAASADVNTTHIDYWMNQPAVASAKARSFDALWNACRDALVADGFIIDRTDYREGRLTSLPLVSKQVYELWRNDVVDARGLAQSTLGTMRRRVEFDIRRLPDGTFSASPKVVVERYSEIERRITSVAQYYDIFSLRLQDVNQQIEQSGAVVPAEYWYAVGRDHHLEKQLAGAVQQRLRKR